MMNSLRNNARKVNNNITMSVIDLHDRGYTHDFMPTQNQHFLCLQNSEDFAMEDLSIEVIDEGFDQLTNSYKYIHAIETSNGAKGLLVWDEICTKGFLAN